MSERARTTIRILISATVLLGFLAIWVTIVIQTWLYEPTKTEPKLPISGEVAALAGLLSTTVAAGTAAALGFEIPGDGFNHAQRVPAASRSVSLLTAFRVRISEVLTVSRLLAAGSLAYMLIGAAVAITYLVNLGKAPEILAAFYLAAVGWALAAFTATFKKT